MSTKATNPKALGMNPTALENNPDLFQAKYALMGFIESSRATLAAILRTGRGLTEDNLRHFIQDCDKAKENAQEVFRNTM